jgi:hypothetical protein
MRKLRPNGLANHRLVTGAALGAMRAAGEVSQARAPVGIGADGEPTRQVRCDRTDRRESD